MDYAEQAGLIAKRAKLAVVNRQIDDLQKARKVISLDYESADAQFMLAKVRATRHVVHMKNRPAPGIYTTVDNWSL